MALSSGLISLHSSTLYNEHPTLRKLLACTRRQLTMLGSLQTAVVEKGSMLLAGMCHLLIRNSGMPKLQKQTA